MAKLVDTKYVEATYTIKISETERKLIAGLVGKVSYGTLSRLKLNAAELFATFDILDGQQELEFKENGFGALVLKDSSRDKR